MQVVLRDDVDKVGKRGDIVEVANGFARNFLIPRGYAFVATKGVAAQAAAMRTARDRADAKKRHEAEELGRKLVASSLRIQAHAGSEGRLFGSVTNAEIVEEVKSQLGFEIDRRRIELHEPIRSVGTHEVPVKLHPDVHIKITVEVVAQEG